MEMHHHIDILIAQLFVDMKHFFVVLTLFFFRQMCGGKFLLNFKHCPWGNYIHKPLSDWLLLLIFYLK
jgi:hypothetical protein